MTSTASPTTTPLLASIPADATSPTATDGAYFPINKLVGTWHSSADTPTGYNVMPLPAGNRQMQTPSSDDDWISKNFYYYEEMTFTAPGEAPNRGQLFQQGCYGLTYEQRVYFAPNTPGAGDLAYQPAVAAGAENTLVHYENGLWLHTQFEAQPAAAYGAALPYPPIDPTTNKPIPTPTPPANPIVKQVSVPHGNSIMALGSFKSYDGLPTHDVTPPLVPPFSISPSTPVPAAALAAEVATLAAITTNTYKTTQLTVSTDTGTGGSVTNIPFEVGNADVSGYEMDMWIIDIYDAQDPTTLTGTVLQYQQKIPMIFSITQTPTPGGKGDEGAKEVFYHVTANTLTKVA